VSEIPDKREIESVENAASNECDHKLVSETDNHDDARQSLEQERARTAAAGDSSLPPMQLVRARAEVQSKHETSGERLKDGTVVHKDAHGKVTEVDFADGRVARLQYDASGKVQKFLVTGPDGKEREYVQADKQIQTPGAPTRYVFDGGAIDNQTDKPILVVGKGIGHEGNTHGDGYLRIVSPNTKTDASARDYDGIITDKNYQPVIMPDGKVLMPASVGPEADWLKVPDRNTGVVTDKETRVDTPWLPPYGDPGMRKVRDYTGGRAVTPETPEIRERDKKNQ
jgi:hypothetical protein